MSATSSVWSDELKVEGDQEASPTGAIKSVAGSGGGMFLLYVLAVGMLLYAAWRVVSALLPGGGDDAKAWLHRVGFVVSAVLYTVLAFSAFALAREAPTQQDGNQKVTDISASVMENSGGRLLIGVIGAIVIAVGLYRISKGVKLDVNDELDLSGMSSSRVTITKRIGAVGEIGRGIGFGLVGFFLVRAAVTFNAAEATGLDGALRRMVVEPWGLLVVFIVGIGFVAYGLFCATTFTHRRLEAP